MSRVFNGTSATLDITNACGITAMPFTVFAYVKKTTASRAEYFWRYSGTSGQFFTGQSDVGPDRISCRNSKVTTLSTTAETITTTWEPVLCEFTTSGMRLIAYGDDVTESNTHTFISPGVRLHIGSNYGVASWFDGKITHFTIWNGALTSGNITDLIDNAADPATIGTPVANWAFTDTSLVDSVSSFTLTDTNTTTDADNPTLAASGTIVPQIFNNRQQQD